MGCPLHNLREPSPYSPFRGNPVLGRNQVGWFLVCLSLIFTLGIRAETLWQIGDPEDRFSPGYNPADEFSPENGRNDPAPGLVTRLFGDPLYNPGKNPGADDDFYTAGIYPKGFNKLTNALSVPNSEPYSAWERALTEYDRTNRVHFILNAKQAGPLSRLRLTAALNDAYISPKPTNPAAEGFGLHDIVIRFRNASGQSALLYTNLLDRATTIILDFNASQVAASAGPNTIEIARVGPTIADAGYWIEFDFLRLDVDSESLTDADGDGLPRWWEEDNGLSDSDPSDAASDRDGDGLTALQEYHGGIESTDPNNPDTDGDGLSDGLERSLGTNPLLPDSDHDGLTDGAEVNGQPATNPLLADTDGDGVPDALELRVGTDPRNAFSVPTVFRGGIGLHFVSGNDLDGKLGTNEVAGVVPQTHWNETQPMVPWRQLTGGNSDIAIPTAGQITRSDGAIVAGMAVTWNDSGTDASHNHASSDRKLMDGFISGSPDTPLQFTVSNIPFAHYDLYVYLSSYYDSVRCQLLLNGDLAKARNFQVSSTAPFGSFLKVKEGYTNFQRGNFTRYAGMTARSASLSLLTEDGSPIGIAAIQIIDLDLDSDKSGIPDWYEMKYQLEPGSAALAAADSDGDGLTNLQEYQHGTDPHLADTDGDGLSDGKEVALGTDPLNPDTDGDHLTDSAELAALVPTNPLKADSDGDGASDRDEMLLGTDPNLNIGHTSGFSEYLPQYRSTPARWEWKMENVQFVWDHSPGALAPAVWGSDTFAEFFVINTVENNWRSLDMNLRYTFGALTYDFHSESLGAFSGPESSSSNIDDTDQGNPITDLTPALGFSGFGRADVSDRLSFSLIGDRSPSANSWRLSFELKNLTSGTTLVSRTFENCQASATLDNGSAVWRSDDNTTNRPSLNVHPGVQIFITPTPLETLAAFAATRDSDKDGMPDIWEDANGFDKHSPLDATADADGDGLSNRDEYLRGTNPWREDTDGDGISDKLEILAGSDPLRADSKPEYTGLLGLGGSDLDHDGLPDVWQTRYRAFRLSPSGDADGDGASNALEAQWGTDPFDPNSKPYIGLINSSNNISITWPFVLGKRESLMVGDTVAFWTPYNGPVQTSGGISSVYLANRLDQTNREFYRVALADRDSDGDGVSDWDEMALGTDPFRADSAHSSVTKFDAAGNVTGILAGDYVSFLERMSGGPGGVTGTMTRAQAARFLQQASFGPTPQEIDRVRALGFAGWIDDQVSRQPMTLLRPYIEQIVADMDGPRTDLTYNYNHDSLVVVGNNYTTPFARAAVGGPDQLRQRLAFALSQIMVASRRDPNLDGKPLAMSGFYDIFVRHAFGNYLDILREVTLHPVMGRYLSHVGNQKARPEVNQFPDENYAREVQQLFTIGLWELNLNGERKLDAQGQPIATYVNSEVTEFARIFTGLWFGGMPWGNGGWTDDSSTVQMEMWPEKHDFGMKHLHNGVVLPARAPTAENGMRDIEDALRNLFEHPNTAPFISKQLIQFLVTSNPSSNYVGRVAARFVDNGAGRRGDLAAVVKAILLDEEARDLRWAMGAPEFGRLKEPVQRVMTVARLGRLQQYTNLLWWTWGEYSREALQEPGYSPSVFNFFKPSYQPPGLLAENSLVGPAFQILDSYSSIAFPNKLWEVVQLGFTEYNQYDFPPDYAALANLADTPGALVDELNLIFCGGLMSSATRQALMDVASQVGVRDRQMRVLLTVYLAATCPEGAVQR